MRDRIDEYLACHESEIHQDILRLVAIPSVSEDREGARRALGEFLAMASSMGFSVEKAAGGDVGIASVGPDAEGPSETMGILAHVDVVDPGDPAGWTRPVWGGVEDGAVWGRGTLDDKGPLVICLWAVKALRDLGCAFRRRVSFVVGTMEEIGWTDMEAYRKEAKPPDFGFTPDGEFPVINREKGHCDVVLSFDRSRHGRVGEYGILDFRAGSAANAVPDSARVALERLSPGDGAQGLADFLKTQLAALPEAERAALSVEIGRDGHTVLRAKGKAAHSSIPEQGDNALVRLCRFLARLGRNGMVDFVADNFSEGPAPGSLGLQTRPEYVRGEYIGPTTASPDLLEASPGAFELTVNLRMSYGQTERELREAFEDARRRYGYSFRLQEFLPALFISKDRPFMKAFLRAYEGRKPGEGEYILAPGTSYAKAIPNVAAFGPVFPGQEDFCHRPDEHMGFEDIRDCARIYADAILEVVRSPEPMA